jgi:DNA-binding transcriptional LysR family regulator
MRQITRQSAARHDDEIRLESFDLNLLRVLDALLVAHSVSGAARQLDLSQPAASAALARLRECLRDPLLVRRGNRMAPTPLAEQLRPRVARIIEEIGEALSSAARFDPVTTARHFRIGANDYTTLVLLVPLAQRLQRLAPRATLEILPCDTLPDTALVTREMDLIVADRWSLRGVRDLETLFREYFVSIARADHPRLSQRPTLKEFLDEGHALISPRGVTPGVVDYALEALGHTRRVALTVPHYVVAPVVVARTDLVMTLPRRVADCFEGAYGLRTFRPPLALEGFDVVMASHPRSIAERPVQWLKEIMRVVAADVAKAGLRQNKLGWNQGSRGVSGA